MRDFERRHLPIKSAKHAMINDEKRSRTFMTTLGMKTFRIQPMIDDTSLAKYQAPSERPQRTSSPLAHSTPKPGYSGRSSRTKPASSQSAASQKLPESQVKTSVSSVSHSLCSSPSRPISRHSNTSGSSHSTTFNIRSSSCTPSHLYMKEELRNAAKKLTRPSVAEEKTSKNNEVPTRFGKPVTLPDFVKTNPHLKDNQLSMGQKQYLWGIARIYSVSKLKRLKQLQYQDLLDHEFKRRLQNMGLKEREKVKEMKDYLRYTKFINTYEQRIPRNLRPNNSASEKGAGDHIYKHAIKGWTTNVENRMSSRATTAGSNGEFSGKSENNDYKKCERGGHIYKHVIKGWTMDPSANDAFRNTIRNDDEDDNGISMTELENVLDEGKSIYRVDISPSKTEDREELVKITKLNSEIGEDFMEKTKNGEIPIQVSLRDSTAVRECNFL